MKEHEFVTEVTLAAPIGEVFPFFADAMNLQRITPPWLDFRVVTPHPIEMKAGALIDYRLKVRGLPIRWRTRIEAWEPGVRFVDTQIRGPYRKWWHEHTFEAVGPDATRMRDRVVYAVRGGPVGDVVERIWVRKDVRTIFAYREQEMVAMFGRVDAPEGSGASDREPVAAV